MKSMKTPKVKFSQTVIYYLFITFLFILLINGSSVFSQVKIKERVELKPGIDTSEIYSTFWCMPYTWIDVEIVKSIPSSEEYGCPTTFFGQVYDVKLTAVHSYCVSNGDEVTREIVKFDFDPSQIFDVWGTNQSFCTYIISGTDTVHAWEGLGGIRQGFRIYSAYNQGYDSLLSCLNVTTFRGALRYDGSLRFAIKQAPVKVSFTPENIAPGDTALINLQMWSNNSKTYEPYPSGQEFEIGVEDGCGFGEILTPNGEKNSYYKGSYDSNCTLKFIASDTLNTDSASVILRVGIPEIPLSYAAKELIERKPGLMKTGKSDNYKRLLKMFNNDDNFRNLPDIVKEKIIMSVKAGSHIAGKPTLSTDNINACSGNNVFYSTSVNGALGIIKKVSDWEAKVDFQEYNSNWPDESTYMGNYTEIIHGEAVEHQCYANIPRYLEEMCNNPIIKNGQAYVKLGVTNPLWKVPFCDFSLESNKDYMINAYRFHIPDEVFKLKLVKDLCYCNLNNKVVLKDISDIYNLSEIQLEEAIPDLKSQYDYANGDKYFVKDAIMWHEDQHREDLRQDIQNSLSENYSPLGVAFKSAFSKYSLSTDDKQKAKNDFWNILYCLKVQIKHKWDVRVSDKDYEENTQKTECIQNRLKEYIKAMEDYLITLKNPKPNKNLSQSFPGTK